MDESLPKKKKIKKVIDRGNQGRDRRYMGLHYVLNYNKLNADSVVFDSIIDNITEGVFYKDLNGKYTQCNLSMAEEILGYEKDEIIGMSDEQLLRKKYKNVLSKFDEKVIEEQIKVEYEGFLINDYGNMLFIKVSKVPYYDGYGKLLGVMGIIKDLTQVIDLKTEVDRDGEIFYQLAQNIDEVFWLIKDGNLIYISPGYERVWERKSDWLYDDIKNLRKNIFYEDEVKLEKALKGFKYDEHGYFNEKYRIVKPDRNLRWIWERSFPIRDKRGNIIRKGGVAEDITTLKIAEEVVVGVREAIVKMELEKRIIEIKQFEELDNLRTEFFANLSHELRTPVNMILTSLKMLEITENTNESKYLKLIKQNSYRLLRLINNLIDTTRLDAGFLKLNRSNMDIVEVVREITLSVSEYAADKGIFVSFETEVKSLVTYFDSDKMERILLNLLSNAIKFNKPKGEIKVSIREITDKVIIDISDTGIGIPENKINKIFERFKQIESRIIKESEGSGIGLSLVKSLVELHSGTINVNSVMGEGSEFIIKLPKIIGPEGDDNLFNMQGDEINGSRIERIRMEFSDIYGLKF